MLRLHWHSERQVRFLKNKKIVFIIVEGPSDDEALGVIFSRFYDKNVVHVEIIHGDITSDIRTNAGNKVSKIGNIVRAYSTRNHYTKKDFQEIIHLIDMDGAFIPDDNVVFDKTASERTYYSLNEIRTASPKKIIDRNKRKSENINKLCYLNKVWVDIPYRAFYMSSNLDHVLYGKINCTDDEKEENAYKFAMKYKDHLSDFLNFISNSDFSRCDNYKSSWEFIKKGTHSLERNSNLGICFKEITGPRAQTDSYGT